MAKEQEENGNGSSSLLVELPLREAAEGFELEKAICSHGLFMLAPNHWDPISRSFSRPLRLTSPPLTVTVRISQPPTSSSSTLYLRVYGASSLSPPHRHSLLNQVSRMLRLSESEENKVREFRSIVEALHGEEEATEYLRSFSGRVFRSPTLFEDMVKCIILCNCQFSRTLSMAKALCELQFEIQHQISSSKAAEDDFIPKTPAGKESKRKLRVSKVSMRLESKFTESKVDNSVSDLQLSQEPLDFVGMGSFPSPEELANLDESFLAKRCNLGYRASRILKLGQGVVQGNIQLTQLEEDCKETSFSSYDKLSQRLRQIDGFGPFTCANVLMCMRFYHVIPADSETIRHLKQVHSKSCTVQTVGRDVELIYAKYAPFQFLAYWAEMWHFYGQRFGKLSELPVSDYKFITASNMKNKKIATRKRSKTSAEE
ncbi:hypothetical protein ERO13_D05G124100v2 [Gossypium hirsutum]|uniref:Uncharacterized protein isoform X2 n=1 Tax=Gossypium hirsutum TaxID=3635 RepID=A0A1U8JKV6_GOSHI|nr:uncharacterized protein LOC107906457 isoform X2 [Gossypium hirsutum]KAG4145913.1 hypothetical protein ERO13_D05G124100v2 [Gossypium hirsutum]